MSQSALLAKLKEWPQKDLEQLAAQLLVIHQPGFHGSKVIHYANGRGLKLVDQPAINTRDI
jgi:hypothetical protein